MPAPGLIYETALERRRGTVWLGCCARLCPGVLKLYGPLDAGRDGRPEDVISVADIRTVETFSPSGLRFYIASGGANTNSDSLGRCRKLDLRAVTYESAEEFQRFLQKELERVACRAPQRTRRATVCGGPVLIPVPGPNSSPIPRREVVAERRCTVSHLEQGPPVVAPLAPPSLGPRTLRLLGTTLRRALVATCEAGGASAFAPNAAAPPPRQHRGSVGGSNRAQAPSGEPGVPLDLFHERLCELCGQDGAAGVNAQALALAARAFFDLAGFKPDATPRATVLLRRLAVGALLLALAEAGATLRALYLWLDAGSGFHSRLSEVCENQLQLAPREALAITSLSAPLPRGLESLESAFAKCIESQVGRSVPAVLRTRRSIRAAVAVFAPAGGSKEKMPRDAKLQAAVAKATQEGSWLNRRLLLDEALFDPADSETMDCIDVRGIGLIPVAEQPLQDNRRRSTVRGREAERPAKTSLPVPRTARTCVQSFLPGVDLVGGDAYAAQEAGSHILGIRGLAPDMLMRWTLEVLREALADTSERSRLGLAVLPMPTQSGDKGAAAALMALAEAAGDEVENTPESLVLELHEVEGGHVIKVLWPSRRSETVDGIETDDTEHWVMPLEEFARRAMSMRPPAPQCGESERTVQSMDGALDRPAVIRGSVCAPSNLQNTHHTQASEDHAPAHSQRRATAPEISLMAEHSAPRLLEPSAGDGTPRPSSEISLSAVSTCTSAGGKQWRDKLADSKMQHQCRNVSPGPPQRRSVSPCQMEHPGLESKPQHQSRDVSLGPQQRRSVSPRQPEHPGSQQQCRCEHEHLGPQQQRRSVSPRQQEPSRTAASSKTLAKAVGAVPRRRLTPGERQRLQKQQEAQKRLMMKRASAPSLPTNASLESQQREVSVTSIMCGKSTPTTRSSSSLASANTHVYLDNDDVSVSSSKKDISDYELPLPFDRLFSEYMQDSSISFEQDPEESSLRDDSGTATPIQKTSKTQKTALTRGETKKAFGDLQGEAVEIEKAFVREMEKTGVYAFAPDIREAMHKPEDIDMSESVLSGLIKRASASSGPFASIPGPSLSSSVLDSQLSPGMKASAIALRELRAMKRNQMNPAKQANQHEAAVRIQRAVRGNSVRREMREKKRCKNGTGEDSSSSSAEDSSLPLLRSSSTLLFPLSPRSRIWGRESNSLVDAQNSDEEETEHVFSPSALLPPPDKFVSKISIEEGQKPGSPGTVALQARCNAASLIQRAFRRGDLRKTSSRPPSPVPGDEAVQKLFAELVVQRTTTPKSNT